MVLHECDCGYSCGTLKSLEWHFELEHDGRPVGYKTVPDDVFYQAMRQAKLGKTAGEDFAKRPQKSSISALEREDLLRTVATMRGLRDVAAQEATASLLEKSAASSDSQRLAIAEEGAIAPLVSMLRGGAQAAACDALAMLCQVPLDKPSSTAGVQEQSGYASGGGGSGAFDASAVNKDVVKLAVVQAGAVPALVSLIRSARGRVTAVAAAARVLRSLALDDRCKHALVEAGAIDQLVELVNKGTPEAESDALTEPANFNPNPASLDEEQVEGGEHSRGEAKPPTAIPPAVLEAATSAAHALRNLGASGVVRAEILRANALDGLVRLADATGGPVSSRKAADGCLRVLLLDEREFSMDAARALVRRQQQQEAVPPDELKP